jgi:hypothetical protein
MKKATFLTYLAGTEPIPGPCEDDFLPPVDPKVISIWRAGFDDSSLFDHLHNLYRALISADQRFDDYFFYCAFPSFSRHFARDFWCRSAKIFISPFIDISHSSAPYLVASSILNFVPFQESLLQSSNCSSDFVKSLKDGAVPLTSFHGELFNKLI